MYPTVIMTYTSLHIQLIFNGGYDVARRRIIIQYNVRRELLLNIIIA